MDGHNGEDASLELEIFWDFLVINFGLLSSDVLKFLSSAKEGQIKSCRKMLRDFPLIVAII